MTFYLNPFNKLHPVKLYSNTDSSNPQCSSAYTIKTRGSKGDKKYPQRFTFIAVGLLFSVTVFSLLL